MGSFAKVCSKPEANPTEEYLEHGKQRAPISMLNLLFLKIFIFFPGLHSTATHIGIKGIQMPTKKKRQEPREENSPTPCTPNSPHEGQKAFVFFSISLERIQLAE